MKRFVCFSLMILLLFTVLPSASLYAAEITPVIALTQAPALGDGSHFEGIVFREDGGEIRASDYRIALYVQVTENSSSYYPKPTYAQPYTELNADGTFSVNYNTGGDTGAECIHILLIPSSLTPGSDFNAEKNAALDYVLVKRLSSEEVQITPKREVPQPKTYSVWNVSADKIAVDIGFYIDGSRPGDGLDKTMIAAQLHAVEPFADTIRLYASSGELEPAYEIAAEMGFTVVGGAWLCGDEEADRRELDALIAHCNAGLAAAVVVGSETQLRGDLTEEELIADIAYVREHISNKEIPVTTADSIQYFQNSGNLRAACDVLFVNSYPYWSGVAVEEAGESFQRSMEALQKFCPSKQVVCSETGWPTEGGSNGQAAAGEAEAAAYYQAVREWSLKTGTQIFFFDAADEPWKTADEGAIGAHWGILNRNLTVKDGYAACSEFRNIAGSLTHYQRIKTYQAGQFRDVGNGWWYVEYVQNVWEYGLMIGKSADRFDPEGEIRISEVITLACRLHNYYYGKTGEYTDYTKYWYDGYVRYAKLAGIIQEGQFTDYDRFATRREVAQILTAALPAEAFTAINAITSIPDVSVKDAGADAIYLLYRAGVLNGINKEGFFVPNRNITRAEIATVVTRTVDAGLRKKIG